MTRFYWIATLVVIFCSSHLWADEPPPTYRYGQLRLGSEVNIFTSTENFSSEGGELEDLPNGGEYQNYFADFSVDYSFAKRWNARGVMRYSYASSNDGEFERTNSDVTSLSGLIQYKLTPKPFNLLAEFGILTPIRSIDEGTDESLLNEGVMEIDLGLWMRKSGWMFEPFTYLGYKNRNGGRSSFLMYRLGIQKRWQSIEIGGVYKGNSTVQDDEFADAPETRSVVNQRVNAGSLAYYGVNPEVSSLAAWLHFKMQNGMTLKFSVDSRLNGQSAAAGNTFMVGFDWRFDLKKKRRRVKYNRKKKRFERKDSDEEQFEIESQQYNEELFNDDGTPRKPKKRRRVKRKKAKSLQDFEKEVESDLLNEAEDILEN